jgi:hypothetical protein
MATVILRPTSTTTETGWTVFNMHTVLGDNDANTGGLQNNTTCNFTGVLADLESGLSGATINNFTISLTGKAGRAGAATVTMSLVHSSDGVFASEDESFGDITTTETTSERTTQQDGSSHLSYSYINNCSVRIAPNNQGITAYELFVTVDFTPGAAGKINIQNGKIELKEGRISF